MITIGIPQIIYIAICIMGIYHVIARHGDVKTGRYNAFSDIFASSIVWALLWWGGFFG